MIPVWQIAQRDYKFGKGKHRSLTKATYDAVGDHFRTLWGQEAGWAHSVLFAADLRTFAERLLAKVEVVETVPVKEEPAQTPAELCIDHATFAKVVLKRESSNDSVDIISTGSQAKRRRVR